MKFGNIVATSAARVLLLVAVVVMWPLLSKIHDSFPAILVVPSSPTQRNYLLERRKGWRKGEIGRKGGKEEKGGRKGRKPLYTLTGLCCSPICHPWLIQLSIHLPKPRCPPCILFIAHMAPLVNSQTPQLPFWPLLLSHMPCPTHSVSLTSLYTLLDPQSPTMHPPWPCTHPETSPTHMCTGTPMRSF